MVLHYHLLGIPAYLLRVGNSVFYNSKISIYLFCILFSLFKPLPMGFHYPTDHLQ